MKTLQKIILAGTLASMLTAEAGILTKKQTLFLISYYISGVGTGAYFVFERHAKREKENETTD